MKFFPNPLVIEFGKGVICIREFDSCFGRGVVLSPLEETKKIGEKLNMVDELNRAPKEGELLLLFTNPESLLVLKRALEAILEHGKENWIVEKTIFK